MTDQRTSTGTADDRQYMGSAADAKAALVEKTRAWRETRQPSMATPREHREAEIREHQLRFEVANAAALWLWHEENPEPVTPAQAARPYFDGDLVNRQCKLGDYCKCCAGKPCLCPNYEGPGAIAQQTQWQPIETAPKRHGLYVDLWMPKLSGEYGRVPDCKWLGHQRQPGWYAECDEGAYYVGDRATHWMYRPESPSLPSTDDRSPASESSR